LQVQDFRSGFNHSYDIHYFLVALIMQALFSKIVLAGVLVALTPMAHAFSDSEAREAIIQLRQQVRDLTESSQRASIQLASRIDQLEQEVARIRGQLEELNRPTGSAFSGSASPSEKGANAAEQSAFDGGLELFRKSEFKEAQASLGAFLTLYPNSPLAPTAMFYQGSSSYALKDFKSAITQLQAMAKQYPDHARAPDALLVVAGSQFELNSRSASRTTLQKIIKDYPKTPAAETAAKRLQLLS
jgi:tol-pal system protein YbgF